MEKLSKYVALSEVTRSNNAKRLGIDNTPTDEHKENLKLVCLEIFDKIREHFDKPIGISSGYRSKALNDATPGSSSKSHHCTGQALDIDADIFGGLTNKQIFEYIHNNLEYNQLIWEFGDSANPDWVHASYVKGNNKKQTLRAFRRNGKVIYEIW